MEIWIEHVDNSILWKVNATDYTGKTTLTDELKGGLIFDDDTNYPTFSSPVYERIVTFNESIPVSVRITDDSGVSFVNLTYDYDYSTGIDGFNSTPDVFGDVYSFTIPAPCPGIQDEQNCDYKGNNMKFWVFAVDNDNDRENDNISTVFESQSLYIDPPGEEYEQPISHDPYIYSYGPSKSQLKVKEGRSVSFNVEANDPDLDDLEYIWTFDGEEVSTSKYFTYSAENGDAGVHELLVEVSDDENSTSKNWEIEVTNELCESELLELEKEQENSDNGDTGISPSSGGGNDKPTTYFGAGGGGGGTVKTTTSTTITKKSSTTTLKENKKPSIQIEPAKTEEENPGEVKSPMTGSFGLINVKYVLISFLVTSLMGVLLIKILPLGNVRKNPE